MFFLITFLLISNAYSENVQDELHEKLYEAVTDSNIPLEMVYKLIRQGGNVNYQVRESSLLHHALIQKQPLKAYALLQAGADPKAVGKFSYTPLHMAATVGDTDNIVALVDAGAAVDAKDAHGRTPLWFAEAHNRIEAMNLLIQAGADIYDDDIKYHQSLAKNSEAEKLLKHEIDKSKSFGPMPIGPMPFLDRNLKQECHKERVYLLNKGGCITNRDFFELKRRESFPLCNRKSEYVGFYPCSVIVF